MPGLHKNRVAEALSLGLLLVAGCGVAVPGLETVDPSTASAGLVIAPPYGGVAVEAAAGAGSLGGTAGVDNNGNFGYRIPLELPPGRNGLTPELALSYSSGQGNGLLGVGWGLTGLSSITPCPTTIGLDGESSADGEGAWCLDGERLIEVGSQGADAEYRRLRDDGTKVIITANQSGAIAYQRGGNVLTYSRVERGYVLARIQDRELNAIDFGHLRVEAGVPIASNALRGAIVGPDRIDYPVSLVAARGSDGPTKHVRFCYSGVAYPTGDTCFVQTVAPARPDTVFRRVGDDVPADAAWIQRLYKIVITTDYNSTRREYTLSYDTAGGTGRSKLRQVQECATAPAPTRCKPPTTFDWQIAANTIFEPVAASGLASPEVNSFSRPFVADLDGDTYEDLVQMNPLEGLRVYLGSHNGLGQGPVPFVQTDVGLLELGASPLWPVDLDSDGGTDLIGYCPAQVIPNLDRRHVCVYRNFSRSNPDGFGSVTEILTDDGDITFLVADLNGDGLGDLVAFTAGEPGYTRARFAANRGTGAVVFDSELQISGLEDVWVESPVANQSAARSIALDTVAGNKRLRTSSWSTLVVQDADQLGPEFDIPFPVMSTWGGLQYLDIDAGADPLRPLRWSDPQSDTDGELVGAWARGHERKMALTADLNEDGRPDVFIPDLSSVESTVVNTFSRTVASGSWRLILTRTNGNILAFDNQATGNPAHFIQHEVLRYVDCNPAGTCPIRNAQPALAGDFNGDGHVDIALSQAVGDGYQWHVLQHKPTVFEGNAAPGAADLLRRVTNGYGLVTSADYALRRAPIYTMPTPCPSVNGRAHGCVREGTASITAYMTTSGSGEGHLQAFFYESQRFDRDNRINLGFSRVTSASVLGPTMVTRVQDFDNDTRHTTGVFRHAGLLRAEYEYTEDLLTGYERRRTTANTWEFTAGPSGMAPDPAARTYLPYVHLQDQDVEEVVGGAILPLAHTELSRTVNDLGLPINEVSTTTDGNTPAGQTLVTDHTYDRDLATWSFGLASQIIQHTTNEGLVGRRVVSYQNETVARCASCMVVKSGYGTEASSLPLTIMRPRSLTRFEDDGRSSTLTFGYDAYGNVNSETSSTQGQPDRQITATYDAVEHSVIASVTNPMAQTSTFVWDPICNQPLVQRTPYGNGVYSTYDRFCRPITRRSLDKNDAFLSDTETYSYTKVAGSNALQLGRSSLINGSAVERHDTFGRTIYREWATPTGTAFQQARYNTLGQLVRVSSPTPAGSPAKGGTHYEYDSLGRLHRQALVASTVPVASTPLPAELSSVVSTTYGALTRTVVEPSGASTVYTYNGSGQIVRVKDALQTQFSYEYSPFGALHKVIKPDETVTFFHDSWGQLLEVDSPGDSGSRTFEYSAFHELTKITDGKGKETRLTIDVLGRTTAATDEDGVRRWIYDHPPVGVDAPGNLVRTESPDGIIESFTYDSAGRVATHNTLVQTTNFPIDYAYTAGGQLKDVTYPALGAQPRLKMTHFYEPNGDLARIEASPGGLGNVKWKRIETDASGRVTKQDFGPNLMRTEHVFDPTTGWLSSITTFKLPPGGGAPPPPLQRLVYNYTSDGNGNVYSRTDTVRTQTEYYGYDALNRLTSTQVYSGGQFSPLQILDYDIYGNIRLTPDAVGAIASTPGGRIKSINNHATHTYDLNGSLESTAVAYGGLNIAYNAANRPQSISSAAGVFAFGYSAGGERVRRVRSDNQVTVTIQELYERVTPPGGPVSERHYVKSPTGVVAVAERINGVMTWRYLHSDAVGSADLFTDGNGAQAGHRPYSPFGRPRQPQWNQAPVDGVAADAGFGNVEGGFATHQRQTDAGITYARGRYYDGRLGRFLSADTFVQAPFDTQSWNRYAYARNNPLLYNDPSGHFFGFFAALFGGIFGSVGGAVAGGLEIGISIGTGVGTSIGQAFAAGGTALVASAAFANAGITSAISPATASPNISVQSSAHDHPSSPTVVPNPFDRGYYKTLRDAPVVHESLASKALGVGSDLLTAPFREIAEDVGRVGEVWGNIVSGDIEGAVDAYSDVVVHAAVDAATSYFGAKIGKGASRIYRAFKPAARQAAAAPGSFCFAAGTMVLMADGSTKRIEDVREGDEVLASDPLDDGPPGASVVTRTHRTATFRLFHIAIGGDDGGVVVATGSHPFWTQRGWVPAEELTTEDVLLDANGFDVIIRSVGVESRDEPTYNLSVEGVKTFYVVAGSASALVHNVDPWDVKFTQSSYGPVFENGPWKGRLVEEAVAEARALGRLPPGLTLNAVRIGENGEWATLNNRTLGVARQAGLLNVNPVDAGRGGINKMNQLLRDSGLFGPVDDAVMRCK